MYIDVGTARRAAGYHKRSETARTFRGGDVGDNPRAQRVPTVAAVSPVRARPAGL